MALFRINFFTSHIWGIVLPHCPTSNITNFGIQSKLSVCAGLYIINVWLKVNNLGFPKMPPFFTKVPNSLINFQLYRTFCIWLPLLGFLVGSSVLEVQIVTLPQRKVSRGAKNIIRTAGFLIMTIKHNFPWEWQL